MRGTKSIVMILGVAAIGMFAATSASASAPEFGRCLKQATKSLSNFDNAKCVKLAGEDAGTEAEKLKKGNYQWFSGVVNDKFTLNIKPETIMGLETVGGFTLTCKGETGNGEYTSAKTVGGLVLQLSGCEFSGGKCNTPGKGVGDVTTAALEGVLGVAKVGTNSPRNDTLALELHAPVGQNFADISCGGLTVVVRGSMLHMVTANAMKLTTTEKFVQTKGIQKPDHFAGGTPKEHVLETSKSGFPFEQSGLALTTILTNEEKVEASTIN
jgi:hypothetical protein